VIKFIRELWLITVERAKARKAVRLLVKQSWSIEFLVYLLTKSTELSRKNCYIVLKNKDSQELVIHAGIPQEQGLVAKEKEFDITQEDAKWEAVRDAAEVVGLL